MSTSVPGPLPDLRRIVAAHDANGIAVIQSDGAVPAETMAGNSGIRSAAIWVTQDGLPTNDNNNSVDGATRKVEGWGIVEQNGTNLRYTDLAPGASTPMHRTSSMDYNILVHGSITLITDDGAETTLSTPGDTVIQKGNMHAWRNPGTEWARWVAVILPAIPVTVGERTLEPVWLAEKSQ
ncbi:hypothetical protein PLICRDRAFT_171460 [Plicaturopsis crispa FD-325 SS-3]|nr:hypothetical protein PLICRDRAFT_171460 [Plicaturopsis crispa FD-325 SS-3]